MPGPITFDYSKINRSPAAQREFLTFFAVASQDDHASLWPSQFRGRKPYGWSLRQSVHNHWEKGPDGAWGVLNNDDDSNQTMDDAASSPPFEPGHGDDVNLSFNPAAHPSWTYPPPTDWPEIWPMPTAFVTLPDLHPIEVEAVRHTDNSLNEGDYADKDWGYPGKQHKTVGKWDD